MCKNLVSYWVPKGWDYREVKTKCGNTDVYGERAICDECAADDGKMARILHQEALARADNETARACGWGEY